MNIKFFSCLACIFIVNLYATQQESIEGAINNSDPRLLVSLLENVVLTEQEKLDFQRMAYDVIKVKEKQFKQNIKNFQAFKSRIAGSLCGLALLAGAASSGFSYHKSSPRPVLVYGLTLVPLVGIMFKLHKLGKTEEHAYRIALCKKYNSAIEKALQVNLLMHGWKYNKEGFITGPFLSNTQVALLHYYTYLPMTNGYSLQKNGLHF